MFQKGAHFSAHVAKKIETSHRKGRHEVRLPP
jgi:hypothetical protein